MMMRKKKIETYVPRMGCRMAVALAALSLASCINEDLSDCGADYAITYTLRLHTNLRAMLDDELRLPEEQAIAGRLETALAGVFTDRAADIDLSFYTGGALRTMRLTPWTPRRHHTPSTCLWPTTTTRRWPTTGQNRW